MAVALAAVAITVSQLPGVGTAGPPTPPNPSDDELQSSSAEVQEAARRVGALASQVADARAALTEAQIELAQTYQEATAAQERQVAAEQAAADARTEAERTAAAAEAAGEQVLQVQQESDGFIAATYRQGSEVGSVTAYFGAESPQEVMARAQILNSVSGSQLDALDNMRRARIEQGNTDAAARAALEEAERREQEAIQATELAEAAYDRAIDAEQEAQARTDEMLERHAQIEAEHQAAQRELADLQGMREEYEQWEAERERERLAEQARTQTTSGSPSQSAPVASSSGVVRPTTGTLTSTYGPRWGYIHYGIDIANVTGTPIYSVLPGTVLNAGPASGFGLWVKIRHDNGVVTVYGHNDRNTVSSGQRVTAGQQIATIGSRGQSTGPHLHFEVHINGAKIDPLPWLRANGVNI